MQICLDQRTGVGCGTENRDGAQYCTNCGKPLRFALQLRDPGAIVGAYRIVRLIGYGGFGAVYEAEHSQQRMRVALKETFDASQIQSFQREFAVLNRLQHPHLPRYFAAFEADGNGYLAMEFVPGQSLEEIVSKQKGPLLETQVLGYAVQLCEALGYLHSQKPAIIHRDVKPANVRLTPEGVIKLVDFGLVKEGLVATRSSGRMGTPAYAPPEQWGMGGQHTEARSDLYSLGATLYHLLTGAAPPPATDRIARSPDPLTPPRQTNTRLSPAVADALTLALAMRLEDRPANAATLSQLLFGGKAAQPAAVAPAVAPAVVPVAPAPGPAKPSAPAAAQAPANVQVVAPPFMFRTGKQARDLNELVQTCVADAPAAIWHLNSGHFETWLAALGHDQLSKQATAIRQQNLTNTRKLKAFLDATGVRHGYQASPFSNFDWVRIPAGEFLMGSDPTQDAASGDDERPQHRVYLDEFFIARTPVTNAQWKLFVDNTVRAAPSHWPNGAIPAGKNDHPVVNVSWDEVVAYCQWTSVRLPTEAEWEKAARGMDGRLYPWGYAPPDKTLCNALGSNTTPVDKYPKGASPYGVLDMAGNVWEWTVDWYDGGYYASSPARNPSGPKSGSNHVIRGGSHENDGRWMRCAARNLYHNLYGVRLVVVGFRVASPGF